jgi:hypothetical protein
MYMFRKDSRIQIVHHAFLNKTCVAKRTIKKNERFYFWGKDIGKVKDDDNTSDYALNVCDNSCTVDPTPYPNSLLQYVNAPGPDEEENITPTNKYYVQDDLVAQEFRAVCNIPKGFQILWSYGDEVWFSERNITRQNCHTNELPTRGKNKKN